MASSSTAPLGHGDVELVPQNIGVASSSNDVVVGKETIPAIKSVETDDSLEDQDETLRATKSTRNDAENMRRMGKDQQLVRHFRLLSVTSFVALATAAWEIGLFVLSPGLINGGRAGLIYNVIWNFIGFGPIYLSMAEMASIAPIAGAQYHWVSEFAPENCQRILSYITGWTSTIAWQAGNALGIFLVASLIQIMITVNDESYTAPPWQCTLLAILACAIAFIGNVYGAKVLPYWQNAVFAVHVLAYFAYIVPVWVSAPKATHKQVWGEFSNTGGYSSMGLALMVGQLAGVSQQVGIDTAAHMSEEVKNAAYAVPRAMLAIYVVNFILIFPAILTVCYHIPSIDEALADTTTYPAVYVLRQAMSTGWITVVLVLICLLNIASNIVYLAAVTRDLFAFARDKGLPFSGWLSKVHHRRRIPENACIFTCVVSVLLAMIYIGSPVAFYAITSLLTCALLQCYSLSIGCMLWRRIAKPETLPPAQFSLGRWGIPINACAVLYSVYAFFWSFWPQYYPVTAPDFNWASPIFGVTFIGAMLYFVFVARKTYFGPVTAVEGRKVHAR